MSFNFSAVQLDRPPGATHSTATNGSHKSSVRSRRTTFANPAKPTFNQLQLT